MSKMKIVVGQGSCGIAAGAGKVYERLESLIKGGSLADAELSVTGCIGMCYLEPIVDIYIGDERRTYVKVERDLAIYWLLTVLIHRN